MKKLIITLSASALLFASCQKEAVAPKKQTVKYNVSCAHCSVYVTDNYENNGQSKHFLVDGQFDYSFDNDTLSQASLQIYVGSFAPSMPVRATITTNEGKKVVLDRNMGFSPSNTLIDTTIVLNLK